MKKIRKSAKPVSAEAIAQLADRGQDVSRFFRGRGRMVQPIQRVNVDVTATMLEELDKAAEELNVRIPRDADQRSELMSITITK
jgi:hypothetical protein